MQLTRIEQHFTFLTTFNQLIKGTQRKLTRRQLAILLTVRNLTPIVQYISATRIHTNLPKLHFKPSYQTLHSELKYLCSLNLISAYKPPLAFHNVKYSITVEGENELNDLELLLRKRTKDKPYIAKKDKKSGRPRKQAKPIPYETNDHVSIVHDDPIKPVKPVSAFSGKS